MLLLQGLFAFSMLQPIADFARDVGYPATPYGFVFMCSDLIYQMIIMGGAIWLFCNAPFQDQLYPYLLARSGRRSWTTGNLFYIWATSFFYLLYLFVISILPFLFNLSWSAEWGKIWTTLAKTNVGGDYAISVLISDQIRSRFTPLQAVGASIALEWLCASLLGTLIYVGNRFFERPVGLWVAAFFVFYDITIYNMLSNWHYTYSPVSLARLTTTMGDSNVSLSYAFIFLILANVLSAFLAYTVDRRAK